MPTKSLPTYERVGRIYLDMRCAEAGRLRAMALTGDVARRERINALLAKMPSSLEVSFGRTELERRIWLSENRAPLLAYFAGNAELLGEFRGDGSVFEAFLELGVIGAPATFTITGPVPWIDPVPAPVAAVAAPAAPTSKPAVAPIALAKSTAPRLTREIRLRSAPTSGFDDASGIAGVDRVSGTLRGVSAIQSVDEALGHGVAVDGVTLRQVADGINAAPGGIKVRFTHPGMCEDGTGKLLGKGTNARVAGGKVLFDVKLSSAAKTSPQGNLYQHVLDLATETPSDVGFSIVAEGRAVWRRRGGEELCAVDEKGAAVSRPADAEGTLPRFRVDRLRSVDLVDEPAANRDGLFAEAFANSGSELGEQAFGMLDELLASRGISRERAVAFAQRYFTARGITKPLV